MQTNEGFVCHICYYKRKLEYLGSVVTLRINLSLKIMQCMTIFSRHNQILYWIHTRAFTKIRQVFHKKKIQKYVFCPYFFRPPPPPIKFRPKNNRFGKGIFRFLRTGFKGKKTNKQRVSGRGRLSSVHLC